MTTQAIVPYAPLTPKEVGCDSLTIQQEKELAATGSVKGLSPKQCHMVIVNKHRALGLPDDCGAYVILPIGGGVTLYESARLWNLVGFIRGYSFSYSEPHFDEVTETVTVDSVDHTHTHPRIIQWAHLHDAEGRKLDSDKTIVRLTKAVWKERPNGSRYKTGEFVNLVGEERDNKEKAAISQAKRAVLVQYLGIPLPPRRPRLSDEDMEQLESTAIPAGRREGLAPPAGGGNKGAEKPWHNPVWWDTLETADDYNRAVQQFQKFGATNEDKSDLGNHAIANGLQWDKVAKRFYRTAPEPEAPNEGESVEGDVGGGGAVDTAGGASLFSDEPPPSS